MNFLLWHYSEGINYYLESYLFSLKKIYHNFSLDLLIKTLFSPYKKLLNEEKHSGFDLARWFERVSFNLVSRFIGAIVRTFLFVAGSFLLLTTAIFGALGILIWVIFPFLSLNIYIKRKHTSSQIASHLVKLMKSHPEQTLQILFDSTYGRFIAKHLNVSVNELVNAEEVNVNWEDFEATSISSIFEKLLNEHVWSDKFLRDHNITQEDIILAASWVDRWQTLDSKDDKSLGRPGIGLELISGYTPTLNKYSRDLSAKEDFTHHLIGRENAVKRIERSLNSGQCVMVTGKAGVGKHTVVLEFARRASIGELGRDLSYRRVMEFDYNPIFSTSSDINAKKTLLQNILNEASSAGNVILVMRDLHRLINPKLEGYDFSDVFENVLGKKKLKIISILSNTDYERFLSPNGKIAKYFERIEVVAPSPQESTQILVEAAHNWENQEQIIITTPAIRKIIEGSEKYVSDTPFPEKALELLDNVVIYKQDKDSGSPITPDDVNIVLGEKTGVSLQALTKTEQTKLADLENIIHKFLINQEHSVKLIAKILRSKTAGVMQEGKPLGSFLFLGPTGVGKTQTAKVLADVYFGDRTKIIRFDMAEYAGQEGIERLIGSASREQPGVLTNAIKNNPASLLLLDELEKAPKPILNLFLRLLDEGIITDAGGNEINCQNIFVVATSNAGSEKIRQLVQSNTAFEELNKQIIDFVLAEHIFSPEFINRFDGVVVYEPLSKEHLMEIAKLLVNQLTETILKEKNIEVVFDEDTINKIASEGYDPSFGARPMKRVIDLDVGDSIGKAILENDSKAGIKLKVSPGEGKGEYITQIDDL